MKKVLLLSLRGIMLAVAFVAAGSAIAATTTQQIAYSWTIPTTRVDGSALPVTELASYNIYYTIDGGAVKTLAVPNGASKTATLSLSLAPKSTGYTITSTVTAVDTEGNESAQSAVVTSKLTVQNALPSAPGNLKVTVTCASGSCSMVVQ